MRKQWRGMVYRRVVCLHGMVRWYRDGTNRTRNRVLAYRLERRRRKHHRRTGRV
jgi:hypothetical protein